MNVTYNLVHGSLLVGNGIYYGIYDHPKEGRKGDGSLLGVCGLSVWFNFDSPFRAEERVLLLLLHDMQHHQLGIVGGCFWNGWLLHLYIYISMVANSSTSPIQTPTTITYYSNNFIYQNK